MKTPLLFLCLLAQVAFAQPQKIDSLKIDSLKRELVSVQTQPKGYSRDTLHYKTLKALMIAYAEVKIDSSFFYNTLAINLCQDPKLQKELIYAYQYAGYLYSIKRNYYRSIQLHYKALTLAEKLKQYTRMARSFSALAHAYNRLEENDTAKVYGRRGLAVLRKYPDAKIQAAILNVFGAIYREQGKLADALKVNQDMYTLAKRNRIQWYEAQGLLAIGWVYKDMGDTTNALAYYKKALRVCHEKRKDKADGLVDLEGNILANIANLFVQMKKWPLALEYCSRAKQIAIQTNNSNIIVEVNETLYRIFKNTGDLANALKFHERFAFLKDSLSKETSQQRIELLQAQYNNEVKLLASENKAQSLAQNNNLLILGAVTTFLVSGLLFWNNRRLQAKNQEIDRQRALVETAKEQLADINKTLEIRVDERTKELVTANRELIQKNEEIKQALFKGQTIERKRVALDLHDNLSSLLSAANMSMQSINPLNLPESEQYIYQNVRHLIQNAYTEVRNISHNILPAELEREGLATTLTTFVHQLNQNLPLQFSLTITGLKERLPVGIEANVYSIVWELITNAIKHANANTITISLFRTNLGLDISVADDGIGLNQHPAKRGVGLQNIQTRLDNFGGIFTIMQPAEKGTRISIKIPIETV